jgi:predicted nucleotidyltransferase
MFATKDIATMAARIKAGMDCRVFLFGSYGWGRPNACSDVDLAVVVPDRLAQPRPARLAAKLSGHGAIPVDFIWLRETTLATSAPGTLSHKIRTQGREL